MSPAHSYYENDTSGASGHTGTTQPHFFCRYLAPLQYPLLYTSCFTLYTHFFIHVAFVSDIFKSPVPRKLGLMGYTRHTVQALTIVCAKCAGAIHLTIRGVPGRAWAQLLLEEES